MKKIDFIDIIKRAAMLTWKNRFLWFFGFLVLVGSVYPNYSANSNKIFQSTPGSGIPITPPSYFLLALLSILALVIFLALYVLKILATAGLIKSANDVPVYKNAKRISILKEARDYFWTLLFVEIVLGFSLLAVFLVISAPVAMLFLFGATIMGIMMGALGTIIFVPIAVIAFFLKEYAFLFAVIGGNKTRVSLERAYNLFKNNVRESLVMGLFLVLAVLSFWLALLCSLIIVLVILGLIFALLFFLNKIVAVFFAIILLVILLIFFIVAFSFAQAFLQVSWVLFFQKVAFIKDKEKIIEEKLTVLENAADTGTI